MRFLFTGGKLFAYPYWLVKKHLFGHNYKSYGEAINRLSTPLDIQCFMFTQFEYIPDKVPKDEWQPPDVTWDRKGGDCEDWALWAMKCLRGAENEVFVLSFYPPNKHGHATCVFEESKNVWVTMGTFGLRRVKGPLTSIPGKWYKDWKSMCITNQNGKDTWIMRD